MDQLPDAPWIVDAELNGYPATDSVHCPFCGEECETIYLDKDGDAFGCDCCVTRQESYDWWFDQRGEDE